MEPPYSNHQAMRAEVVLRSIAPLAECPLIFSVGSFGVKTKDGRRFRFDWCQSRTDVNNDKEGRMVFVADLRIFDVDYFIDSCEEDNILLEELTLDFITNSQLEEVLYECYINENKEEYIRLELEAFAVYVWSEEKNDYEIRKFPTEEIKRYNELKAKEWMQ